MKSITNKRAIIVGLFIFLGLVFLMIGILTIGNLKKTFGKTILVKTIFDDVNGLQKGNNIWFSGVKIGTVKKISFHGNSQVEVTMGIEEKSQQYIRKDAKAKISTDGLIGNKIVVLYGGSSRSEAVEDGDHLAIEKNVSTDDMMNTLQENNKNLLAITGDLKNISGKLQNGQGTIGKLLKDESLYNNMESAMKSLKTASASTQQLTASLSDYSSKLNRKGGLANDIATDTVVFQNVKNTVAQLNQAAQAINGITKSLQGDESAVGLLMHDKESAANLKNTLKNLESGSQKLDEDLEALQHNFLLRGFFKKKAKKLKEGSGTP